MNSTKILFTPLRNNTFGFLFFLFCWQILSWFYPPYIVPSPLEVATKYNDYISSETANHIMITLYRSLVGFALSFFLGMTIGLLANKSKSREIINLTMILFQVIPGTILGIIFLIFFGIGDGVPIALVTALALPLIAVNTSHALEKRNIQSEQVVLLFTKNKKNLVADVYIPALIPTISSNLTLGMSMTLKVVVLGEFIGSQNGLGYLLNVAKVYFNMDEVFLYLFFIIFFMVVFQILISFIFRMFLYKFFFTE